MIYFPELNDGTTLTTLQSKTCRYHFINNEFAA